MRTTTSSSPQRVVFHVQIHRLYIRDKKIYIVFIYQPSECTSFHCFVSLSVFVQVGQLFEACIAAVDVAGVGSLSCVGEIVVSQSVAILKGGRTFRPSTCMIFNAFVGKVDMSVHVTLGDKS